MPSPIGHTLLGLAVYSLFKPQYWRLSFASFTLVAAVSVLADLDFLPGFILGDPNRFHREISHSISVVGFSLVVIYLYERTIQKKDTALLSLWFFIMYSLHIIADYFGADTRPPYGQPILWPLSDSYFLFKTSIFWDIQRSPDFNKFIPSLFSRHNFIAVLIEIIIASILWGVLFFIKKAFKTDQNI